MSLVKIFRREANRLRTLAETASCDADARCDFLNQANHYEVLANQAASRQLPVSGASHPALVPAG